MTASTDAQISLVPCWITLLYIAKPLCEGARLCGAKSRSENNNIILRAEGRMTIAERQATFIQDMQDKVVR